MFCFANAAIGRLTGVKLLPFRGFAKLNSLNQSAIQGNTSNYKWGARGCAKKEEEVETNAKFFSIFVGIKNMGL